MLTNDAANIYINWAMYAVYGMLREADTIMRLHGDAVHEVAEAFRRRHPIPTVPLYRGLLVDPTLGVSADPNYRFVSWSEDRDVARWFALRDAYINVPIRMIAPEACGYFLTMEAPTARVLFHHTWARMFPMPQLALMHPHMGAEGARQIDWSLRSQHEVITEPLAVLPTAQPIETVDGATVRELDARLSPPWGRKAPSEDFFVVDLRDECRGVL